MIAPPQRAAHKPQGVVMNAKAVAVTFGLIGTASFLVSAMRPELLRDAVRVARWHHRWN
jgi:hypothetical protein